MSDFKGSEDEPKQGSLCCGCCCDMRRAVIIINIVSVVLGAFSAVQAFLNRGLNAVGEDYNEELVKLVEDNNRIAGILNGVGIVFSLVAIAGAVTYNIYLVGANIVVLFGVFAASAYFAISGSNAVADAIEADSEQVEGVQGIVTGVVIGSLVVNFIFTCIFAYPHVGFIAEVRNGVMTKETYHREEASCCCV